MIYSQRKGEKIVFTDLGFYSYKFRDCGSLIGMFDNPELAHSVFGCNKWSGKCNVWKTKYFDSDLIALYLKNGIMYRTRNTTIPAFEIACEGLTIFSPTLFVLMDDGFVHTLKLDADISTLIGSIRHTYISENVGEDLELGF